MIFKYAVVIFIFYFNIQKCYSQIIETKLGVDTLETEDVIYEVDTVFLQPDTVTISDTIIKFTLYKKERRYVWASELMIAPYVSGIFNFNVNDSVKIDKIVNWPMGISLLLFNKSIFYGVNINYTLYNEKITCAGINNSDIQTNINAGYYDSINYTQNCILKNNYKYLSLHLILGKNWKFRKYNIMYSLLLGGDILLKGNAYSIYSVDTKKILLSETMLRQYSVFFGLSTSFGYFIHKNVVLFLAPYGKLTYKLNKDYPVSNRLIIGLGAGLRKYF